MYTLPSVFDFDVAVVTPVPPIDRFEHIDLTPFEMNSSGYRDPVRPPGAQRECA
jgi:hypothetical protein